MPMIKILLLLLISSLSLPAFAHPTAFEGAWGFMSYNDEKENEFSVNYSFKSYIAGGVSFFKFKDVEITVPRVNTLLKRWNNEDSQGNIYLSGGYGLEKSFNESQGVGFLQADADWESRQYYVSAQYVQFLRKNSDVVSRDDIRQTKLRAGFAPYLADYNDLNTWLIWQIKKENEEDPETTQFVRLFYRNVLIELGATFGGGWAFNYIVHF